MQELKRKVRSWEQKVEVRASTLQWYELVQEYDQSCEREAHIEVKLVTLW